MTLQASAPISLNDIYDEAVSGGYSGSRSLNALIAWGGWADLPGGADSILDFLGVSAGVGDSFSIGSQDSGPSDIFFKPDGTKMYFSGFSTGSIYEYDLSTAWDITTASYSGNSFDSSTEESSPSGIFMNSSGSKLYVCGFNANIYEYSLSINWDISSASYNDSLDVSGKDNTPNGLFFKSDGSVFWIVGSQNGDVHEYSMSTSWDTSTGSFVRTFSPPSITAESAIFFKSDGTKMYFLSNSTTTRIYEYTLSTAWNISTASYSNDELISEDNFVYGLFFKSDGTKIYPLGDQNNRVYQSTLGTAWSI